MTIRRKLALKRNLNPLQETKTMLNNIQSKTTKKGGGLHKGLMKMLVIAGGRMKSAKRLG
jgi:hypothetical protein